MCNVTRVSIIALVSATVWTCSSCSTKAANRGDGWPSVFHYNVSIDSNDPAARERRADLLKPYLERRLGIPVEITATVGYGGVIEAMRAKKIDASTMGPFAYLIATEKANVEALAARGASDGTPGEYRGTFAVRSGSPIQSMDDVRRSSRNLTLSFVDPASASGYLVQRQYLDSIGIVPEKDFKQTAFSNNHIVSGMTLLAGKVDIAAISESTLNTLFYRGKIKRSDIRVIWTSPNIPNSPLAVRKDLPADLKKKVQDAFVAMVTDAPEVFNAMQTNQTTRAPYIRIDDSAFDEMRQLARGVDSVRLLEH